MATHSDDGAVTGSTAPSRAGSSERIYDLAIVGYGPAGSVAANLAGQAGLDTIVIERDAEVFPRQRAISIDAEALRILRNIGLYDEVTSRMHRAVTVQFTGVDHRPFLTITPLPTELCGEAQGNFFHQPWLEAALRDGVKHYPSVQVRCGWQHQWLSQDTDAVTLHIADADNSRTDTIRARYLLACDGGSSAVRKELGVDFAGISYEEKWVDVQARLKRPMHASPHFEFISHPTRPGVKCPCPAGMYRWEWRVNPDDVIGDTLDEHRAWELLADVGVTTEDVEITRSWVYTFHVRKCTRWRVGRVLMVGDAAHVMPPFAGQGISGAFRDAANVVWKVAAVLRGAADEALLDSYQTEREPHHDAMTASAVRIGKLVMVRNRHLARARDTFFRLATRLPGVQHTLSRKLMEPAGLVRGYLDPSASKSKTSPVGQLIKAVTVAVPGVRLVHIDEALGTGWSILGLDADPRAQMAATTVDAWSPYRPRYFTVRPGNSVVDVGELGDPVGQLWDWMTTWAVRFLIVRPDRYVYAGAAAAHDLPTPALTQVAASSRAGYG